MKIKSKYKTSIKPIKIKKEDYKGLKKIFNDLKNAFFDGLSNATLTKSEILNPGSLFAFKYNVLSPDKMDLLGPTVESNGKIYKMIKQESVSKFVDLWQTGILQSFIKRKWIPDVHISDYYLDGYPLILEVEYLPNLLGLREVPSINKRKEMIVFVSFICYLLQDTTYSIADPHSGNFGLSNKRTYFFDLGSFIKNNENSSQYSLVIGGLETILFSFFPESLLSTWDMFTSRNDFTDRIPRELSHEYLYFSRRFVIYHLLHSSPIVFKASRRVFKYYICNPWDLIILFFDKKFYSESNVKRICQFD